MGKKKKLLYVDDEEMNTLVFKITFSETYDVLIAKSGLSGLKTLRENPDICFIISDFKMDEMNGLEFIKEVKKSNDKLPCMILSGYHQTPEIIDAIKTGVIVDCLKKPFNKVAIEELIGRIINTDSD